jgi:hypothetical protein
MNWTTLKAHAGVPLLGIFAFAAFHCDGAIVVQGTICESAGISRIVSTLQFPDSTNAIENATVVLYEMVDDSGQIPVREFAPHTITSTNGAFDLFRTVCPLGEQTGALIVTKEGYLTDTLFFRYKSLDTVRMLISLRRVRQ